MTDLILGEALGKRRFVMRKDGRWVVPIFSKQSTMPLVRVARSVEELCLVFENDEAINDFLVDADPDLEQLRAFVRVTRTYLNVMVMTAAEVLQYVSVQGEVVVIEAGHWVQTLQGSTVEEDHDYMGADLLNRCRPRSPWKWNAMVDSEWMRFRYERLLEYWDNGIKMTLREHANRCRVQDQSAGLVSTTAQVGPLMLSVSWQLQQRFIPSLNADREKCVEALAAYHEALYDPPALGDIPSSTWGPQARVMPLDVLAANQAHPGEL